MYWMSNPVSCHPARVRPGFGVGLCVSLAMMLLEFAWPCVANADDFKAVDLVACNTGNVEIDTVNVSPGGADHRYTVLGWISVPPHECANIFAELGDQLEPLFLGFAFTDSAGVWAPATVDPPDYGTDDRGNTTFTRTDKQICVARKPTTVYYGFDSDDIATHCEDIHGAKGPDLSLFAFPMALHFSSRPRDCPFFGSCTGGDYYLDIEAPAQGHQLSIHKGLSPEQKGWKIIGNFLQAVIKAGDESRQRHEQEAVDAAQARLQHARDLQAAREEKQKQILAADAAGDRGATVEAQMIRREQDDNRKRWAGTRQSPAAYDPKWKGQNVAITGTVSRVEVDPNGSPQWVSIYFKESPDATFVVCSPYPDLFQEKVGLNISVLVGKTLEAAGQVESPYCGSKASKGSIRVVESTQWTVH
jgi:hypothetical protein